MKSHYRSVPDASLRRGAVSAMVIVVMVVLSLVVLSQVRRVLAERRHTRDELQHLQTMRLCDAGLLLAERSLRTDQAWTGTDWQVPVGAIDETNSGRVIISVDSNGLVTVIASYPSNSNRPCQVTRTKRFPQ
ncbi:MAG: hypothetical protein KDA91_02425 [Planctomycetaceae bacterium]|nr:hypothetical protein [Planctomycetaceae bacterium]